MSRRRAVSGSGLRRSLGVGLLVLYGLGVIIGAGVYVVIGDVVVQAGVLAAWSFAVAGALAGLTALAYAELGARHPEAAGAAAYVKEAFGSDLFSQLTGGAVAVVVLITTAAIARGTAGYTKAFVALPDALTAGGIVLGFTAVACLGVLVLVSTVALPFHALLRLSTTLTLLVFVLVSLSLWRLQQRVLRPDLAFHVPQWVPIAATLGNTGLIVAQCTFV